MPAPRRTAPVARTRSRRAPIAAIAAPARADTGAVSSTIAA
jgi:hypothetical protein